MGEHTSKGYVSIYVNIDLVPRLVSQCLAQDMQICSSCAMATRSAALARLGEIAQAQWGLVTTRQARTVDVTLPELSRLTRDGALERVAFGVYHLAGAPRPRLLELRAAWLQLDPGVEAELRDPASGAVSHASAAAVYEVGDIEPYHYEFTVPARRRTRRADVVLHVAPLREQAVQWVDQLPVTSPPRLIADLLNTSHDGEHVARVAADCVDGGLAVGEELAAAAAPYASPRAFEAALTARFHRLAETGPTT